MTVPSVSFEFFPPKSLEGSFRLWDCVNTLAPLDPSFVSVTYMFILFFFVNDPAPTEIYPISLPDAFPICQTAGIMDRFDRAQVSKLDMHM